MQAIGMWPGLTRIKLEHDSGIDRLRADPGTSVTDYWLVTGMAGIGSLGGGKFDCAGGVTFSVDGAVDSAFSTGATGAGSGGGATGSAAGAGAGSAAGAGAGAGAGAD